MPTRKPTIRDTWVEAGMTIVDGAKTLNSLAEYGPYDPDLAERCIETLLSSLAQMDALRAVLSRAA